MSRWLLILVPLSLYAQMPDVSGTPQDAATLRWIELKAGDGPAAQPGQEYTLHYTGWLHDGTKFDSSVDRGKPFVFVQGRRQVIAGFDIGFAGMKVGGKRRLFLPHQLAYGEKGRGKIPPKAELIFDVELLGVKDVEGGKEAAELLLPLDGPDRASAASRKCSCTLRMGIVCCCRSRAERIATQSAGRSRRTRRRSRR